MILYNYKYDKTFGKITITSVEVVETPKMYKTKSGRSQLADYSSQVRKDSLDTLITAYDLYMVSQECDIDRFKHMIVDQLEKARQDYLNKADAVAKSIDSLSECEVAIINKTNEL